jgi:hypothetical protein
MPTADSCAAAEKRDEIANCERRQGRHGNRKANHCRSAQLCRSWSKTEVTPLGPDRSRLVTAGRLRQHAPDSRWMNSIGTRDIRLHLAIGKPLERFLTSKKVARGARQHFVG